MVISVPGRVNLIGEHIDYHNLPVLPMAIQRRVSVDFEPRGDRVIQAESSDYALRRFSIDDGEPFPPGDWGNYVKAAAQLAVRRWGLNRGLNVAVSSDLPVAAGLSSSSALMTAVALALLRVNEIYPTVAELMELLPDGEQFVGTRGGGMDHAAVLASQTGCALLVHFDPLKLEQIPIPPGWAFIVAHSLTVALKSGPVKAEYNCRRTAGLSALAKLNLSDYRSAPDGDSDLSGLSSDERDAYLHVSSEAERVASAITALRNNKIEEFGKLLCSSHTSLRQRLRVSHPALDDLVNCAVNAGAVGARLTGAGFGGCAIVLCKASNAQNVLTGLRRGFYAQHPDFDPANHLIVAEPSAGALSA
jgi:galactokinase